MRNRKRHRRSPHIRCHLLPTAAFLLLSASFQWGSGSPPFGAAAQCFGGVETYEKTAGTTVMCTGGDCLTRGLLTQPETPVTRDCIAICKQSRSCNSFTVDYLNSRCQSYDVDTNTRSGRKKLERDSIVNYFEKICLRGMRQTEFDAVCNSERGWAFERVLDAELEGHDHKRMDGVESRGECARLCLLERDFDCRSAEYDFAAAECVLSREDRRTQPEAFRTGRIGTDYIENQCAKALPDCSYTASKKDVTVVAMDDILCSRSSTECQRICDDARAFNCRSFAQKDDCCYLSGDDSVTLDGVPQPVEIGAVYKEKICARSTCDGGIFTYEKTTGYFLRTGIQEPLPIDSSAPGITGECSALCSDAGADCPAFSIDYAGQRCFKLDRNTQGRGDSLAPRPGTNYFEKVCLRGSEVASCRNKAWAFERVPDQMLQGFDDKQFEHVPTRRDCEELCLRERTFSCRSAEFDTVALTCALSRNTRRTKPEAVRAARNIDYLENNCISTSELTCPYEPTDNAYPRYLDAVINNVKDDVACEVQCTFYEQFICRSFAFYPSALQCFISGDDTASAQKEALQDRPGTDYYERNCDPTYRPDDKTNSNNGFSKRGPDPEKPESRALPERRCTFGHLTYEKTTGFELIRASPTRLFTDRDGGIVAECAQRCEADTGCQGFNMDYNRNECQSVVKNSENNLFNLRKSTGVSYFEATCLRARDCGARWTFERFVDMELRVSTKDVVREISKTECQDLCLKETAFTCLSANYDHLRRECSLHDNNRFTRPDDFVSKPGVDYLENQCESEQVRCDYSPPLRDEYLIYTDKVLDAFTESTCKQACSQEREFNCRSYSFLSESRPGTPQCRLSGDSRSSSERSAFQREVGAIYAEKECGTGGTRTTSSNRAGGPRTRPREEESDDNVRVLDGSGRFGLSTSREEEGEVSNRDRNRNPVEDRDRLTGDPRDCRAAGLQTTFEKVVDHTYEGGDREQMTTNKDIGIVIQCLDECNRKGSDCLAITLMNERGGRQRCFSLSSSSGVDETDPVEETGVTYYEKICARRVCRKSWTFTRVPGLEFIGEGNEEVPEVSSLSECRNHCLESTFFECRSATYYANTRICKLSEESRRSAPNDFQSVGRGIDYIENECSDLPTNCEYVDQPGTYLPFTDTYFPSVTDIEECRSQCSAQGQYNCRSFNYNAFRKECFLSADDSTSLPTGMQTDRDFIFSERAGCNSGNARDFGAEGVRVRVECTPSDMLVHLALAREFNGRIYATGNPQNCFELGNGLSEMTLRIPLNSQCGTVPQSPGRYVNHVVIQENPVIMQDSDKTVRVECSFTADDQTVSFKPISAGGRGTNGGGISVTVPFSPTGTNIVTNTAPTPGVRMRVVRKDGDAASMVGLGEDLQLRIEIDKDSAFGLFARRLEARTDNGELMNLIDDSGCPVNELIFPALELESSTRALYADFKAFRFPSTPIVNFVATVQFCQELCEPMECFGDIESYGRKRRSVDSDKDKGSYDYYKSSESIVSSSIDLPEAMPRSRRSPGPNVHRERRFLPEHVDLGLRLTVGEDVVQKPFLPSSQGAGHFPESAGAFTEPSLKAYYPSQNGGPDNPYICSPPSTLVAAIVIVLVLNVVLVATFVIFYRQKRKHWSKRVGVQEMIPTGATASAPPPLPSRPSSSHSGSIIFKSPYNQPQGVARQRISGLHSSMSSLPRAGEENA